MRTCVPSYMHPYVHTCIHWYKNTLYILFSVTLALWGQSNTLTFLKIFSILLKPTSKGNFILLIDATIPILFFYTGIHSTLIYSAVISIHTTVINTHSASLNFSIFKSSMTAICYLLRIEIYGIKS